MDRESRIGTEEECLLFSSKVCCELNVWWYHGTGETAANQLSLGTERFDSRGRISFTTDENGASQHHGTHVIRARVRGKEGEGLHLETNETNGLVGVGNLWLHVDPSHMNQIMVEKDWGGRSDTEQGVPEFNIDAETLKQALEKADQ